MPERKNKTAFPMSSRRAGRLAAKSAQVTAKVTIPQARSLPAGPMKDTVKRRAINSVNRTLDLNRKFKAGIR